MLLLREVVIDWFKSHGATAIESYRHIDYMRDVYVEMGWKVACYPNQTMLDFISPVKLRNDVDRQYAFIYTKDIRE